MCFSSPDPPPMPKYTYESFKPGTSTKPEGPANDKEAAMKANDAAPTIGQGLGSSSQVAERPTVRTGAGDARTRSRGTTLGY